MFLELMRISQIRLSIKYTWKIVKRRAQGLLVMCFEKRVLFLLAFMP